MNFYDVPVERSNMRKCLTAVNTFWEQSVKDETENVEDLSKLKDKDECIKPAVNNNADITKKLSVMQKNLLNQDKKENPTNRRVSWKPTYRTRRAWRKRK